MSVSQVLLCTVLVHHVVQKNTHVDVCLKNSTNSNVNSNAEFVVSSIILYYIIVVIMSALQSH